MTVSVGLPERYKDLEEIDSCASAVIYKAEDLKNPRQKTLVAVKVLRAQTQQDIKRVKEFRQDVDELRGLESPYLARVCDWSTRKEPYYLALEYVEGISLLQILQERNSPLTPKQAFTVALAVLEALKVAHKNQYFALEVKPSNVVIELKGTVKLVDFKVIRPVTSGEVILQDQACYSSPEQALSEPAEERSNFYSLGIVLYEMLSGKLPFQADNSFDMLMMHLLPDAAPALTEVAPEVNQVVQKALAKDPDDRYQTAAEMSADLKSYLDKNGGLADLALLTIGQPALLLTNGVPPTQVSKEVGKSDPKPLTETETVKKKETVILSMVGVSSRFKWKLFAIIGGVIVALLGLVMLVPLIAGVNNISPKAPATPIVAAALTVTVTLPPTASPVRATTSSVTTVVLPPIAFVPTTPKVTVPPIPSPAEVLLKEADQYIADKKWGEATNDLRKLLNDYPDYKTLEVRQRLAGTLFQLNTLEAYQEASTLYQNQAQTVKDGLVNIYCDQAKNVAKNIEVEKVLVVLDDCLTLKPGDAEIQDLKDSEKLYKDGSDFYAIQFWFNITEIFPPLYNKDKNYRNGDVLNKLYTAYLEYGKQLRGANPLELQKALQQFDAARKLEGISEPYKAQAEQLYNETSAALNSTISKPIPTSTRGPVIVVIPTPVPPPTPTPTPVPPPTPTPTPVPPPTPTPVPPTACIRIDDKSVCK